MNNSNLVNTQVTRLVRRFVGTDFHMIIKNEVLNRVKGCLSVPKAFQCKCIDKLNFNKLKFGSL